MPPFLPRKRRTSDSPDIGRKAQTDVDTPKSKRSRTQKNEKQTGQKGRGSHTGIVPPRKKTLFDELDTGTQGSSPRRPSELLKSLGEEEEGEDQSGSEDYEFEDVLTRESEVDDDDIEFEDIPPAGSSNTNGQSISAAPAPQEDLDLTLTRETRISLVNPHNKKQGPSKIERGIRIATHQMHVQFLMWHNSVRNRWCCDENLQGILAEELMKRTSFEKYMKRWRSDSGLAVNEEDEGVKGKQKSKSNEVKGKDRPKREKGKGQDDWSSSAQRAEVGSVNMSHGDPLFALMSRLSSYWKKRFAITAPRLKKIGYMSLPRIDEEIKSSRAEYDPERHGERIEDRNCFKELAKLHEGSRDVGAQLFTALLRGLGLEARMVVSLQPVGFGWSKSEEAVGKSERKTRLQGPNSQSSDESSNESSEPTAKSEQRPPRTKSIKAAPQLSGSRSRGKGRRNVSDDLSLVDKKSGSDIDDGEAYEMNIDISPSGRHHKQSLKTYEKDLAPTYWTEVLSPVTNIWIPVNPFATSNPVATNPGLLLAFEPRGAKAEKAKQVMAYIVAFSSDGTAKEVTVRYLKRNTWPGKTKGVRMPIEKVPVYNSHGKIKRYEEYDWFKTVMSGYGRRAQMRTVVDDQEEATDLKAVKPEKKQPKEGEETLQWYKQSAEFVLQRHLRREEALLPSADHVRIFVVKGKADAPATEEKVYLRKDVVSCKSVETWHKEGREPKIGEQPLKRVPFRAATTNRKRELAEAELASGGQKMLQGLYSRDQTDWIIPPPIENGVIPKNGFGNMDCYVPSMVPKGAVHIPFRGTTRICKRLGIDFAEAVTGFEFGARMAIPIITGVVVAEENEQKVIEQWHEYEAERLRKEDEKRTKAALGMWRKFLMGMRIMERVREEYGEHGGENPDVLNPWTNKNSLSKGSANIHSDGLKHNIEQADEDMAGGFFHEGHEEDEVPQSFFPTRHEDSDDDGGSCLVIEQEEQDLKRMKNTVGSYPAPLSFQQNEIVERVNCFSDDDESTLVSKLATKGTLNTKGPTKLEPEASIASSHTSTNDKRRSDSDGSETHKEHMLQTRTPSLRNNGKSTKLPAESPATRTMPKRRATRRSTGTKSQYFEADDDDDDIDHRSS